MCRSLSACILFRSLLLINAQKKVHVAAARRRSHQCCVSLTRNNTKTIIRRKTCHCFLRSIRRNLTSSPSYTTRVKKKTLSCLILFHRHYDKARKIDVFGRELGRGDISLTFLAIFLKKYSLCTHEYSYSLARISAPFKTFL